MKCRHCGSALTLSMVSLNSAPFSNAYLTEHALHAPEKRFPLRVLVCEYCWLAQTEDFAQACELFDAEYSYFSAFSSSWLAHCEHYSSDMVARFDLSVNSHVVEIAANDGCLLQYIKARNIPCVGVEPTASTAKAARAKGVSIVEDFFGTRLAKELVAQGKQADLIAANNVLGHVPDINDFVAGFALLLKPHGVCTFEFPHLMRLIDENQFDTIYHEHFSYLSLTTANRILKHHGLTVFDVEELSTHGRSLRVFAQCRDTGQRPHNVSVDLLLQHEAQVGMLTAVYYASFQAKADRVRDDFLVFLLEAKRQGKTVVGYGAAAKGNTLMNYAGVCSNLISFVVDRNPAKQGKYMPGSHIPIVDERYLQEGKPDYVVILPWNLKSEVMSQLEYIRSWGGQFVTAIPELRVTS